MSTTPKRPMLAETCEDMTKLTFPLLASPKLDGIRCLLHNGVAFSRSLKPLPNQFIQKELAKLKALHGADGELMVGETFQAVTSGVMSRDGEPDFALHVFDRHDQREGEPFANRLALAERDFAGLGKRVKLVPHLLVNSIDELRKVVDAHLASGYEGTMIRSLDGPYKNGRSSLREGYLLKLKPFKDDEAIVTGFYEQEENLNEKKTSELGLSKRSSHQANKRGKGTLGGFYVKHATFGNFNIGTGRGLTAELRQHIWNNQAEHMGKLVKFRYQEAGTKDKPRIPVFLGFRSPDDL